MNFDFRTNDKSFAIYNITTTYLNINNCYFSIIVASFFVQVIFAILLKSCNLFLVYYLILHTKYKAFNTYLNLFVCNNLC